MNRRLSSLGRHQPAPGPAAPRRSWSVLPGLVLGLAVALPAAAQAEEAAAPAPSPEASPAAAVPAAPVPVAPELEPVALGMDLLPGVGTSSDHRGKDRRRLSLSVLGWTGAVDGVDMSLVGSLVEHDLDGFQASAGANLVAGGLDGFQGAAGANVVAGDVDGLQLAGGANLAAAGVDGFQAAGGANVAVGDVDGFQGAGGVNVAAGDVDGFQGAGGANVAAGRVDGVQMAGGVNLARGVEGSQLATINISTDDVDGVQLGVINIARDSDVSLGLINIIYEGRTHVDVWTTETGFVNGALKHGGRYFHYIYGAGWNPAGHCPEWNLTLGMGGHAPLTDSLFLDGDVLAQHISPREGLLLASNELYTGRAVAGLQLFDRLALTAGLSYNVLMSQVQDGSRYAPKGTTFSADDSALQARGWTGWQLGVQIF